MGCNSGKVSAPSSQSPASPSAKHTLLSADARARVQAPFKDGQSASFLASTARPRPCFDGSWSNGVISGEKLTWGDGITSELEFLSDRLIKVTYGDSTFTGEMHEDDKIHWNDGDVWSRCDGEMLLADAPAPQTEALIEQAPAEASGHVEASAPLPTIAEVDHQALPHAGVPETFGPESREKIEHEVKAEVKSKARAEEPAPKKGGVAHYEPTAYNSQNDSSLTTGHRRQAVAGVDDKVPPLKVQGAPRKERQNCCC